MSEAMTVEQARDRGVCRLCGETIRAASGNVVSPTKVTYDFGREYAHTECLLANQSDAIRKEQERIIGILSEWIAPLDMVLPISLVRKIKKGV